MNEGPGMDEEGRSFAQLIAEQRNGQLNNELTGRLEDVVAAAIGTQKKGSVTLTLEVVPEGGNMLRLIPSIKDKEPRIDPDPSMVFAAEDGSLHRNNPNQTRLDLDEARARRDGTGA